MNSEGNKNQILIDHGGMEERPEFFKLDEIDRKVLVWLMIHVPQKSVKCWIDFIADDYKRKKAIIIDARKLFMETQEK